MLSQNPNLRSLALAVSGVNLARHASAFGGAGVSSLASMFQGLSQPTFEASAQDNLGGVQMLMWVGRGLMLVCLALVGINPDLAGLLFATFFIPPAIAAMRVAQEASKVPDDEDEEEPPKDLVGPVFWRMVVELLVLGLGLAVLATAADDGSLGGLLFALLLGWAVPGAVLTLASCYLGLMSSRFQTPGPALLAACIGSLGLTAMTLAGAYGCLAGTDYPLAVAGVFTVLLLGSRITVNLIGETRAGGSMPVTLLAMSMLAWAILVWGLFGNRRSHTGGQLTACKSNLKNMGTAMEMYSTDWSGKYPAAPHSQLTPNYLKTIPDCPAAGTVTYTFELGEGARYNTQGYVDYYHIQCTGDHHKNVSVPTNYPQYNGIVGLVER